VAQGVVKLQPKIAAIISADFGREPEFHNKEHSPIVVWFILWQTAANFLKQHLRQWYPQDLMCDYCQWRI
jgi:hypothetical protein